MSNSKFPSISHNFYRQFFGYRRLDLVPDFLAMMKKSYAEFIQDDPESRDITKGLESVLRKTLNFDDPKGSMSLEYISYELKEPKFSVDECKLQGITYAYSLYINCKGIFYDRDQKNKNKKIVIGENEAKIHMGEIPKMCENGSFLINGICKTIITQIQRIPGVFYVSESKKKKRKIEHQNYACKIIPYTGSWLEFFIEPKEIMYFKLDKKKKLLISTLLLSLAKDNNYHEDNPNAPGYTLKELLSFFYKSFTCVIKKQKILKPIYEFDYNNYTFTHDVCDENDNVAIKAGHIFSPNLTYKDGFIGWVHEDDWLPSMAIDHITLSNGTIIQEGSHPVTKENINNMVKNGIYNFEIKQSHSLFSVINYIICFSDCVKFSACVSAHVCLLYL